MNKVYKVVWSKVQNAYVVASELAKNHTKSQSSGSSYIRNGATAVLVAMLLAGGVGVSYATTGPLVVTADGSGDGRKVIVESETDNPGGTYNNPQATGKDAIAMGNGAKADNKSVAIGSGYQGKGATASGKTSGGQNVAVGIKLRQLVVKRRQLVLIR